MYIFTDIDISEIHIVDKKNILENTPQALILNAQVQWTKLLSSNNADHYIVKYSRPPDLKSSSNVSLLFDGITVQTQAYPAENTHHKPQNMPRSTQNTPSTL